MVGTTPNTATAVETGTSCAISTEKIICHYGSSYSNKKILSSLTKHVWRRSFSTPGNVLSNVLKATGNTPSDSNESRSSSTSRNNSNDEINTKLSHTGDPSQKLELPNLNLRSRSINKSQFHRPTKEELLAAATGFWSRLGVRFKWFSIRSVRPFNVDEITALFSWVLLGHVIWIILGTTTFFSLVIITINTVFAQGESLLFIFLFSSLGSVVFVC